MKNPPNTLTMLAIWAILTVGMLAMHSMGRPKLQWATASAAEGSSVDTDSDGLSDADEAKHGSDPNDSDTDGDGYSDGAEVEMGFSPLHGNMMTLMDADTDNDYLRDAWEVAIGTDVHNADTDGDLYLDGTEVAAGFDPLDPEVRQVSKLINVDVTTKHLQYYFGDALLGDALVATGKPWTPTPTGDFVVLDKIPVKRYLGPTWDYPNTKWNLWFTSRAGWRYYIHGAWWHDKWGGEVSGGCVNVQYQDMEPLYWFAQHGTKIHIE